jgi:hypothetical protein
MADDDVRKFDAKRTVLARGLPLATSTAKVRALPSSSLNPDHRAPDP